MGLFSWLFGKKEGKQIEKIKFGELEEFIIKKKEQNKEKENIIISNISQNILELVSELNEKGEEIKKIGLKDKKAEERIKIIVLENLSYYADHIKKLIENLKKLDKSGLTELASSIDRELFEFDKKSRMSFEKATILVGKELGNVKDSINKFFRGLNKLLEENKGLILELKTVSLIEESLNKLKNNKKSSLDIEINIDNIKKRMQKIEKEKEEIENKINEIKKSEAYISQEQNKKNTEIKKKELENIIFKLKSLIDFKFLENIYHTSDNKMEIIKNYQTDFNQIFEKDKPELVELLEENRNHVIEEIAKIKIAKEEIFRVEKEKDLLEDINLELGKKSFELEDIKKKKEREEDRLNKIDGGIKDIKNKISEELTKINAGII
jgi:hypothetical protein